MDLTDEQWQLIAPLLTPPGSRSARPGRPPLPDRPILDGILWKLRTGQAWDMLPSRYPHFITCYHRYRQWQRDGLFEQVLAALFADLSQRGDFDLSGVLDSGLFTIQRSGSRWQLAVAPGQPDTWQLSTALLFARQIIQWAREKSRTARSGQP
jgi:transposase